MLSFLVLFSLIQFHFSICAFTLSVSTNHTTESMLPNLKIRSEPHCHKEGPTRRRLPLVRDCIVAIHALSHNDRVGIFHIGGARNLWRLPSGRSHGSCQIRVTLDPDCDFEMGSWVGVRSVAWKVLHACRLPFDRSQQKTGGWITFGTDNGILVELVATHYGTGNDTEVGMGSDVEQVDVG